MSTPQSNIFLCSNVLIDNTYRHTIFFENLAQQESYFGAKVLKRLVGYTYLRPTWSIKVALSYAEARRVSYLFFSNPDSTKKYYYFINRIEYINDETTELFLEMDVIQTFMFDFELQQCFIERETTRSDDIGEHTLDEGLEVGELVDQKVEDVEKLKELAVLFLTTESPSIFTDEGIDSRFHGEVYSALGVYMSKVDATAKNIKKFFDDEVNFESVITMWMYPTNLLAGEFTVSNTFGRVADAMTLQYNFSPFGDTLDGHEPKNKKLLTHPFRFLHVDNNGGGSADFRFERMEKTGDGYGFKIYGSLFPDGGAKLVPSHYNGAEAPREYGLTLTGFPTCTWSGDAYKIWLAQNQHSQNAQTSSTAIQIIGGAGAAVGGLALGNPVAAVGGVATAVNGLTSIQAQIAQHKDIQAQPPQARGSQNASVNAVNGFLTFTFYEKCVSKERARIIDDYFTVYGYKVNRLGTPSLKNRTRFTYIKTSECVIGEKTTTYTSMTFEDRQKVINIFNNGITFWVDGDEIGDYTDPNEPLN